LKVADEEGDLSCTLFKVEMAEVKAAEERAEKYEFAREVAALSSIFQYSNDPYSHHLHLGHLPPQANLDFPAVLFLPF
jgi:hypothetical protein